jgi:peptidyl-prolyl cis-trans isomerase C
VAAAAAPTARPSPATAPWPRSRIQTIWASDVKREAVAQGLVGEGEPLDVTSDLFRRVLDEVIDQKLLAHGGRAPGSGQFRPGPAPPGGHPRTHPRRHAGRDGGQRRDFRPAVETIYQEQVRLARTSEEIRTRLILSRTRAEADAVVGILAQGAAFEAVAMERSIDDATRFSGGDLGYSTLDVMPEAYATALTRQAGRFDRRARSRPRAAGPCCGSRTGVARLRRRWSRPGRRSSAT